jgi:hypothetical protein
LSGGSSIIWLRSNGTDSAATYDGRSIATVCAVCLRPGSAGWRGGCEGARGGEPDVHTN